MRTPIMAANWKMHMNVGEALRFVEELGPKVQDLEGVEVLIAAPFTALESLKGAVAHTPIALAAQNLHPEPQGAFTGEISVAMLRDVGCSYAIVGHSERRLLFGETSAFVARKVEAALSGGLLPIVCVGETLEARDAGHAFDVVGQQLDESLARIEAPDLERVVIAYEPVWAIGTGRTATPEIAQEIHGFIRTRLEARFGDAAKRARIQYGGSVKPDNVFDLMAQPDIDGALVGGASLDPASFYAIIRFERTSEESRP